MPTKSKDYSSFTEDDIHPMEAHHFEIATRGMSFKTGALRDAAESVLVGKARIGDAAEACGVSQSTLTKKVQSIMARFEAWAARNKLKIKTVVIHEEDEEVAERWERRTLLPILEKDEIAARPKQRRAAQYRRRKAAKD